MPSLIRFIVSNFADGFLLGTLALLGMLIVEPSSIASTLLDDSPIGLAMSIFAIGSSFGLGSLATALWFEGR